MKKTNTRSTEGPNPREKQDKRMIPICVLQYLIENTDCNNRATVQNISNGLGDYGVFANRDTVQKTLTDLLSCKDDLVDMGFPEIKYEEIRRKNKNYIEQKKTKSADDNEEKWQIMKTNFYVDKADDNEFVADLPRLSESELTLLLSFLESSRKDNDSFAEDLAHTLEELSVKRNPSDKVSIRTVKSKKDAKIGLLGTEYVSEAIKTINDAIYHDQQIEFIPRKFTVDLVLVEENIVKFDPYYVTGNTVVGVIDGREELISFRIDKMALRENAEYKRLKQIYEASKTSKDATERERAYNEYQNAVKRRFVSVISLPTSRKSAKSSKELLDYLAQNPGLDGGKIIRVEMDLRLDAVDEFVDSFGTDFGSNDGIRTQLIGERLPQGYCRASLCASSDYVLKWALMHADKCVIVKPQSLRNRLQQIARYMRVSYIKTKEDKEFYAMDTCIRGNFLLIGKQVNVNAWNKNTRRYDDMTESERVSAVKRIELAGIFSYIPIDLSQFVNTEKLSIRSVWSIDNLNFAVNFAELECLNLKDTAVSNISALANCKKLKHVELCKNPIDDYSVLYTLVNLKELLIDDLSKLDIDKLRKICPGILIRSIDSNGKKYDV